MKKHLDILIIEDEEDDALIIVLEIKRGGSVMGDVSVDNLIMEHGSKFNGQSKMTETTEQEINHEKEETPEVEEEV